MLSINSFSLNSLSSSSKQFRKYLYFLLGIIMYWSSLICKICSYIFKIFLNKFWYSLMVFLILLIFSKSLTDDWFLFFVLIKVGDIKLFLHLKNYSCDNSKISFFWVCHISFDEANQLSKVISQSLHISLYLIMFDK